MVVYDYSIKNTVDIVTNLATLETKINADLDINQTLNSATHNSGIISLDFPLTLTEFQLCIVKKLILINIELQNTNDVQPVINGGSARNTLNAPSAPTANHDNLSNYNIGSSVYHNGDIWICTDNSTGAAIWRQVNSVEYIHYNSGGDLIDNQWLQPVSQTSNESAAQTIISTPGTVSGIYVYLVNEPGVSNSRSFYVNVNGATGAVLTLSDLENAKSLTGDLLPLLAFDRLSLKHITSGTPTDTVGMVTITIKR